MSFRTIHSVVHTWVTIVVPVTGTSVGSLLCPRVGEVACVSAQVCWVQYQWLLSVHSAGPGFQEVWMSDPAQTC